MIALYGFLLVRIKAACWRFFAALEAPDLIPRFSTKLVTGAWHS